MKKILTLTSVLAILAACEPRNATNLGGDELYTNGVAVNTPVEGATTEPAEHIPGFKNADGTIADNPNTITLSDYTQEQQIRDRQAYAAKIAAIAAEREEITSVTVPTIGEVNPAKFARSTSNAVGQKLYSRSGKSGNCRSYSTSYEAQRAFLAAGGPTTDTLGLDKDGDGFACAFNPVPYRSL